MHDDDIVDILQGLIESASDGEREASGAAEQVRDDALRQALWQHASESRMAIAELKALQALHGGRADEDGLAAAAALRRAEDRRARERAGLPDSALAEQVRATQALALPRYERAFDTSLPGIVRATLARHHEWLQRRHGHLGALCERWPGRSGTEAPDSRER